MKCPICKTVTLDTIDLETGLPAHQCPQCAGIWIPFNAYLLWRRMSGQDTPRRDNASFDAALEIDALKICPECGRILRRYQVLPDNALFLDRCNHCNGIWLDKNEWKALVESNLHDNLNEFFTEHWQDRVRAEDTKIRMEKLYLEKFGAADYAQAQKVHAWLKNHPQRSMLLAFLQAEDPYRI